MRAGAGRLARGLVLLLGLALLPAARKPEPTLTQEVEDLFNAGQPEEAVALVQEALEKRRTREEAWGLVGALAALEDPWALETYAACDSELHCALAAGKADLMRFQRSGSADVDLWQRAGEAAVRAVEGSPKSVEAWLLLGYANTAVLAIPEALEALEGARDLAPGDLRVERLELVIRASWWAQLASQLGGVQLAAPLSTQSPLFAEDAKTLIGLLHLFSYDLNTPEDIAHLEALIAWTEGQGWPRAEALLLAQALSLAEAPEPQRLREAERLLETLDRSDEAQEFAYIGFMDELAAAWWRAGDPDEAYRLSRRWAGVVRPDRVRRRRVAWLALAATAPDPQHRSPVGSLALADEGLSRVDEARQPELATWLRLARVEALLKVGRFAEAEAELSRGRVICVQSGDVSCVGVCDELRRTIERSRPRLEDVAGLVYLALQAEEVGDHDAAAPLYGEAQRVLELVQEYCAQVSDADCVDDTDVLKDQIESLVWFSEASEAHRQGDLSGALLLMEEARAAVERGHARCEEANKPDCDQSFATLASDLDAFILQVRAEEAARRGDTRGAIPLYEQALEVVSVEQVETRLNFHLEIIDLELFSPSTNQERLQRHLLAAQELAKDSSVSDERRLYLRYLQSEVAREAGDVAEADAILEEVLRASAEVEPELHAFLQGRSMQLDGDDFDHRAQASRSEWLETFMNPEASPHNQVQALFVRVELLMDQGDYPGALEALEAASLLLEAHELPLAEAQARCFKAELLAEQDYSMYPEQAQDLIRGNLWLRCSSAMLNVGRTDLGVLALLRSVKAKHGDLGDEASLLTIRRALSLARSLEDPALEAEARASLACLTPDDASAALWEEALRRAWDAPEPRVHLAALRHALQHLDPAAPELRPYLLDLPALMAQRTAGLPMESVLLEGELGVVADAMLGAVVVLADEDEELAWALLAQLQSPGARTRALSTMAARAGGPPTPEALSQSEALAAGLDETREALLAGAPPPEAPWRARRDALYALGAAVDPEALATPSLTQVVEALPSGGAMLLLLPGDQDLLLAMLDEDGLHLEHQRGGARAALSGAARLARELSWYSPDDPGRLSDAHFEALGQLLLGPLVAQLPEPDAPLFISAGGALQAVPFAALRVPDEARYLIERNPLVMLPSPTWLATDSWPGPRPPGSRQPSLVLGAVELPGQRLTHGGEELEAVAEALEGLGPVTLACDLPDCVWSPTVETLAAQAPEAGVVHVVSHGHGEGHPWLAARATGTLSYLQLLGSDGAPERLWEHRLGMLPLQADLVTLSACQTAVGENNQLEGALGLSREALLAGSRSALASLWSVDDAATAELMRAFYVRYVGGLAEPGGAPRDAVWKARALQEAQLELLEAEATAHPWYWAAFRLYGHAD